MARLERLNSTYKVKCAADPDAATRIPFGAVAGATLMVVSGSGTVEWYTCHDPNGDLFQMFDSDNAPLKSDLVEGNAIDLPAGLFACPFIVGVGADVEAVIAVST